MAKIDDSVKKKVPELRFPGFTDDWEERKFADFIDVKSGKDYKHLNSGSIPVYGTGGYMLSVDRALSDIDAIGIGRKGTIDKPYLLKAPFWTVDTLFYAVPKQNIDLQFSLSIFKKINWKKFDESTGVPSLSKTVINSVGASVPSYEEQQKIGSFFQQLDETIALHQRKLDLLKEQKKGYLQKMFPKNGAKVPELRFAGFADDWEEHKLSAAVDNIGTGKSKYMLQEKSDLAKYEVLGSTSVIGYDEDYDHEGDFILTARVGANAGNLYHHSGKVKITDNTVFIQGKNLAFIYNLLTQFNLKKLSFGTGQPLVKASELKNLILYFPNNDEQAKIGSYFKQLDHLITLHQRKLDLLKEQKKGFLQNMFV
ncbi:restriction endonuclease subunit S (plasmid) [Loigolactobacillus backii]|uniref:restriction endonuclease subunit S n=1 Tax=Loigolactobacillus backii TaxID=375175 RepID=UPI0007F17E21|nr:restriction endonuclease subunit S [Loigolactobacillus backii]ANK66190.1 restriction endonuclease subunit S [Loigolactobacillus backii]